MFIDYAKYISKRTVVTVRSHFAAKYVPKGGPPVVTVVTVKRYFRTDTNLTTFRFSIQTEISCRGWRSAVHLLKMEKAERYCYRVPVGTIIKDEETDEVIFDLDCGIKNSLPVRGGKGRGQ